MREKLLAAAAIGALLTATAIAQTAGGGSMGAMTEQDMEELSNVFEQAGFTDFQPVTGASVYTGMSGEGESAVIIVAPHDDEAGMTGGGTTGGATTGGATTGGTTGGGDYRQRGWRHYGRRDGRHGRVPGLPGHHSCRPNPLYRGRSADDGRHGRR
jgi:hypothetical protein